MIPIQNIYYMLSYSFQILKEQGYKKIAAEEFHNVAELCTAILIKGVSVQLKRGITYNYISEYNNLSRVQGKIVLSESLKSMATMKRQITCNYDEFSVNTNINKIIKTTMNLLCHFDITSKRKKELKNLLLFFNEVDLISIKNINWNIQYNKNSHHYQMLISVCYLIIKGLLQSNSDGTIKLMDFFDEQRMCRIYERFILEYYRKEHPGIKVSASQIKWQLDEGSATMLPIMQTDIMLSKGDKTLIIDAKYYAQTTQLRYNTNTIHSANLYQIFTYVKNKQAEFISKQHSVAGLLLYAKTDELILINNSYSMSGNIISVKSLDLNCDFAHISAQLDTIIKVYFNNQ